MIFNDLDLGYALGGYGLNMMDSPGIQGHAQLILYFCLMICLCFLFIVILMICLCFSMMISVFLN